MARNAAQGRLAWSHSPRIARPGVARHACGRWSRVTGVVLSYLFGLRAMCGLVTSRLAGVAQLVEQLIRNQQVVGSSPTAGSIESIIYRLHPRATNEIGGT